MQIDRIKNFKTTRKPRNYWPTLLRNFLASDGDCMVLTLDAGDNYVDLYSLQRTVLATKNRLHLRGLHTETSGGKLYIYKEDC